ncbi:MAG: glycosyltransferase family 4 protein [Herminiimonas sp.]|nr:glycosyltransferase family 4 protein [Herminiimonas sp.]
MKLLTFSTLFPNSVKPNHGIFVQSRLRYLIEAGDIAARVVAPVPWFPFKHDAFGRYGLQARVPHTETRAGLQVYHPRYFLPPKTGMTIAPAMLAAGARSTIGRLIDEGFDFDLIDAHYFYPDGVAAVLLGKYFGKPTVISALGTDINLLPHFRLPGKMIRWAGSHAARIITVSSALKSEAVKLGMPASRIEVLRNGVDLALFHPADRAPLRQAYGCDGFTLLSVGNLIPLKGHDLSIDALRSLPDVRLLIAGEGPERGNLERLASKCGVAERVRFLGSIPQSELRQYYAAADALVLPSSREGWANVLLESMACGTPAIATRVGGTPEVIQAPEAGIIMAERSAKGIVDAVVALRAALPDRAATRRYAERFGWPDIIAAQTRLYRSVADKSAVPANLG